MDSNWVAYRYYQDFFQHIVLISEIRDSSNTNDFESVTLSFFHCEQLKFTSSVTYTKSPLNDPLHFDSFPTLLKRIDDLLRQTFIDNNQTFIFCNYGKDLFLRIIPLHAVTTNTYPQHHFLQFIDLRHELCNFMRRSYSHVESLLQDSIDNLLVFMCRALQIPIENPRCLHPTYRDILLRLLNEKHCFSVPIILNPQFIYGQKYYLREPWYNQLPQLPQELKDQPPPLSAPPSTRPAYFYVKVRGIPYSYTREDLRSHFIALRSLTPDDINIKYLNNGLSSGEAYIKLNSKADMDLMATYHKSYLENRYLEILASSFDEFQDALYSQPRKSEDIEDFELAFAGILKLRGLPWSCNEKEVRRFLEGKGLAEARRQLGDKVREVPVRLEREVARRVLCGADACRPGGAYEEEVPSKDDRDTVHRGREIFICTPNEYLKLGKRQRSRSRSRSQE